MKTLDPEIKALEEKIKAQQATIEHLNQQLEELKRQRKKDENDLIIFRNIFSEIPATIYWFDKNNIVRGNNETPAAMIHLKAKDTIDKPLTDFMPAKAAHRIEEHNNYVMRTGESISIEEQVPTPEKTYYFLSKKAPLRGNNNEIIGVIGFSMEISDRKELEEKLNQQREIAVRANQTKTAFIMNMSHDIRTPFSGIIGLSEHLESIETDPEKKSLLRDIKASSTELLTLINSILESMKDESANKKQECTLFSLELLIHNVVTLMQAESRQKHIDITIDYDKKIPSFVYAPRQKLYQILLNLIGNAVKFTEEGKIEIKACYLKKKGDTLLIKLVVSDTGIGIPEDKQSHIFNQFERLNPAYEGNYSGHGLGLWLTKNAIKELKGEINVSSQLGKGSTFTCVLPLQAGGKQSPLQTQDETLETPLPSLSQFCSILLVEDNVIAAKAAKALLKKYFRCELDVAESGAKAINLCHDKEYCLIIMDIGLPDIDGFEITRKIKLKYPDALVVGLTAHNTDATAFKNTQKLEAILQKPLTSKLCARLSRLVAARKLPK